MDNPNNKFLTAFAIIVAGGLIAGAVIYTHRAPSNTQTAGPEITQNIPTTETLSNNEYIIGNPDAKLAVILYFDVNCGHCRNFYQTMQQLMNDYGKNGKIKWVSRFFPLSEFSEKEAEAAECVAELNGNDAYWSFINELINQPILAQDDLTNELIAVAQKIGLQTNGLKECAESGKYTEKMQNLMQKAVSLGIQGTPFSVITDSQGNIKTTLSGAVEYTELKQTIETLLK